MVWTYVPGPNIALACSNNSFKDRNGLESGGVLLRPGRHAVSDPSPGVPVTLMAGAAHGSHSNLQTIQASSLTSLVEQASRADPLTQGWRVVQSTGSTGARAPGLKRLGDAEAARKNGQRLIKEMYGRLGLSSTRAAAVAAAARNAVPFVTQHLGTHHTAALPATSTSSIARAIVGYGSHLGAGGGGVVGDDVQPVVSHLQRLRPYAPVFKPVPLVVKPNKAAPQSGVHYQPPQSTRPSRTVASHAHHTLQHPHPHRSATRPVQPSGTKQRSASKQLKRKKNPQKAGKKSGATAPGSGDPMADIGELPELPTTSIMRKFQLAPRPQMEAAWAAVAPAPAAKPSAQALETHPQHSTAYTNPYHHSAAPVTQQGRPAHAQEITLTAADIPPTAPVTAAAAAAPTQHSAGTQLSTTAPADAQPPDTLPPLSPASGRQQQPLPAEPSTPRLNRPSAATGDQHAASTVHVHVVPTRPAAVTLPAAAGTAPTGGDSGVSGGNTCVGGASPIQLLSPSLLLLDDPIVPGGAADQDPEGSAAVDLFELERLMEEQHAQLVAAGAIARDPVAALPAQQLPTVHAAPPRAPPATVATQQAPAPAAPPTIAVPRAAAPVAPAASTAAGSIPGQLHSTAASSRESGSRLVAELRELGVPLDGLLAELLSASPCDSPVAASSHSSETLTTEWSWEAELRRLGIN